MKIRPKHRELVTHLERFIEPLVIATDCQIEAFIKWESMQNNAAENLTICTRKQHREYHLQLEMIGVELLRTGLVTFDTENGYQPAELLKEVLNARK